MKYLTKNLKIIILVVFVLSLVPMIMIPLMYGNKTIYIANYMPSMESSGIGLGLEPVVHEKHSNIVFENFISHTYLIILTLLVLDIITILILFKNKVLGNKKTFSIISIILIIVIPILVTYIKMTSLYGVTM